MPTIPFDTPSAGHLAFIALHMLSSSATSSRLSVHDESGAKHTISRQTTNGYRVHTSAADGGIIAIRKATFDGVKQSIQAWDKERDEKGEGAGGISYVGIATGQARASGDDSGAAARRECALFGRADRVST